MYRQAFFLSILPISRSLQYVYLVFLCDKVLHKMGRFGIGKVLLNGVEEKSDKKHGKRLQSVTVMLNLLPKNNCIISVIIF